VIQYDKVLLHMKLIEVCKYEHETIEFFDAKSHSYLIKDKYKMFELGALLSLLWDEPGAPAISSAIWNIAANRFKRSAL
jgi:hypothetical protein